MNILRYFLSLLFLVTIIQQEVHAKSIRAAGSSTVFPFITAAAEEFGIKTGYNVPIIEATGTGGGLKLFCNGIGDNNIDFTNASRQIKPSETDLCKKNGVVEITEIKIGYDGIIFANYIESAEFSLTRRELFLALAKQIPENGKLINNPYKYWQDINPNLPKQEIIVYGPPPTSGTRDAFVELVMHEECHHFAEFTAAYPDKKIRNQYCGQLREDNVYVEAGENDNLIIHKLKSSPKAFGIFGYSFLENNSNSVKAAIIDGYEASFENIANKNYPISRSLFVYFKDAHVREKPELKEFLLELISEDAIGEEGYITYKGLIPLKEEELIQIQEEISKKF